MRKFAHVFSSAVSVLTTLVILAAAVFFVPRAWGWSPYIVLSGSMEPEIHVGSVAFVDTKDRVVQEGDVVTYRLPSVSGGETLVTHRVVRQETDGSYVTKGDANDVEDLTAVTEEQIVGTFRFSVPYAGYVIARMNRKVAVVTVAWILLLNGASVALGMTVGDDKEKETLD